MKTQIIKALRLAGLSNVPKSSAVVDDFSTYLPADAYVLECESIYLKKLALKMPKYASEPLVAGYGYAVELAEKANGVFRYHEGKIVLDIKGIQFIINDFEELFIVKEVFIEGCYNVFHPDNVIIIDIGMNVAIASLFLSAQSFIETIYAFELFPSTFDAALKNIALNKDTGYKIVPYKYGLGKEARKLTLPYSQQQKGSLGLYGLRKDTAYRHTTMEEVEIKNASAEFSRIAAAHVGKSIVCKMDCEGAEYDIMEDLHENNALSKADIYMIEWHFGKPDVLIDRLVKHRFTVFCLTPGTTNDPTGLLYAVKNGGQQ